MYLGGENESHTLSHVTNGSQGTHPEENQESCEVLDSSHARDQLEEQAAVESGKETKLMSEESLNAFEEFFFNCVSVCQNFILYKILDFK